MQSIWTQEPHLPRLWQSFLDMAEYVNFPLSRKKEDEGATVYRGSFPDSPECREFFVGDGGVVDKYRKMGVYGFRLDVADELSDAFISKIKERLSRYGESLLYGEVWEDASNKIAYGKRKHYYLGDEW